LAATERQGRSILAIVACRTHRAASVRACALSSRTRGVTSGYAVLGQWPTPTKGIIKAGSAGRGRRQFHRLRAECAKSHRFAPHHEAGDSTIALAAVVTYKAPGRQR
jgi:hypothetical protein